MDPSVDPRTPAPLLVIGIGNPSRGDDALGSLFVERATAALKDAIAAGKVEFLTDFQLQIEHTLDLAGRTKVVFVDASLRTPAPFTYRRISQDVQVRSSCFSHAMSPEALLDTYRKVVGEPPEAWVLAILGERFELGEDLSESAAAHLESALTFFPAFFQDSLGFQPDCDETVQVGRRFEIEGTVQGVGFRPWVVRTAQTLGLTGSVWNSTMGVTVEAFGSSANLDALLHAMQHKPPVAAYVRTLRCTPIPFRNTTGTFVICPSKRSDTRQLGLPPDLATCSDCLHEVNDPQSRYFGYVFTSCTDCGPRFSIATDVPYDRANTSMASFLPCQGCLDEYESPKSRRFHAQTVACPTCGPRLWLADSDGNEMASPTALLAAVQLLRDGKIVGVQGLGAFHLVCNATDVVAVTELRRRKKRDSQPFAVMVQDVHSAKELGVFDQASIDALESPARPIVLVPRVDSTNLPPDVCGASKRVGLMLPYTALHHGLIRECGVPLVVTSGNPSGGPAVIDHAPAVLQLGKMVDAFLFHDRPIVRRVEDSVVAQSTHHATRVIRRSRGFSPTPIVLPFAVREPILAVGAHMKATACIAVGNLAYVTAHLGDLGLLESEQAWQQDVESFERLLGVHADVIAHDLHPEYTSTRYALGRPARRHIAVQHHVAHVFATIAELHLNEPVLGVVFDGTGLGDGPAAGLWGAEFILVDGVNWTRTNSFRPLPLPGGERAIREVWRVAYGALIEAFGCDEAATLARRLRVFEQKSPQQLGTVARMIETDVSTGMARGMGRWFDAVGGLVLGLSEARYDGHVAVALEEVATSSPDIKPYPVKVPSEVALEGPVGSAHEVDLRPTIQALVLDLVAGVSVDLVAARFHRTIVDATAAVADQILAATAVRRVVLAGGSFQNQILRDGMVQRFGQERISIAKSVPINDGGLALGQVWAAALKECW